MYVFIGESMVKKVKKQANFDVAEHVLVPKHVKLSDKEKKEVLNAFNVSVHQLPKILVTDPALRRLDVKPGDIIKVVKQSATAGEVVYYRGVVSA